MTIIICQYTFGRSLTDVEFQHRLYRLSLDGKLYLSPIKEGKIEFLDIATGTGAWAIDFGEHRILPQGMPNLLTMLPANEHPEATVLGTDLSPIQPPLCEAPPPPPQSILYHLT